MEQTCIILKPDAYKQGNIGDILSRFEHAGLKIKDITIISMDRATAESFYAEHTGKEFFDRLIAFMTSGPCVPAILTGENVIVRVREMAGATNAATAAKGTIRGDFSGRSGPPNCLHASDSPESAAREINFFFPE